MSFWYGLSYEELYSKIPLSAIQAYLDNLEAVKAEYKLAVSETTAFPNSDKSGQKRLLGLWKDELTKSTRVVSAPSPEMLRLIGIGVRFVDVKH